MEANNNRSDTEVLELVLAEDWLVRLQRTHMQNANNLNMYNL